MDRREFLTILGGVVAAAGAADARVHAAVAADMASHAAKHGAAEKLYIFFTADEVAFVRAAVARLIPADELGPGALEADVPYFNLKSAVRAAR